MRISDWSAAVCSSDLPAELKSTIEEAFRIATSGRPGPVVVDIPKDVQVAVPSRIGIAAQPALHRYNPQMVAPAEQVAEAIELLSRAERPVFYTGGGVIHSGPAASRLQIGIAPCRERVCQSV